MLFNILFGVFFRSDQASFPKDTSQYKCQNTQHAYVSVAACVLKAINMCSFGICGMYLKYNSDITGFTMFYVSFWQFLIFLSSVGSSVNTGFTAAMLA